MNVKQLPSNFDSTERSWIEEPWQMVVISMAFLVIIVFSAGGNGIVIWIVLAHKRMRSVTNFFLVNLSISDIMAIFHIIPNVYYALKNEWIFGVSYCKFSQFFTAFGVCMSVLTFLSIATERYIVIMYPLRPRAQPSTILAVIALIWLVSIVSGLPGIVLASEFPSKLGNTTRMICDFNWPENWSKAYDLALFVLQYLIPLCVLVCTYVPISFRLWRHQSIGENPYGQGESIRSKRKIVKMMIAIVIIFAICWLPYQMFFMLLRAVPQFKKRSSTLIAFISCYWLAMSNCMYNPIIYYTMNKRFREGFKRVLSCGFCCSCYKVPVNQSDGTVRLTEPSMRMTNLNGRALRGGGTARSGTDGSGESIPLKEMPARLLGDIEPAKDVNVL